MIPGTPANVLCQGGPCDGLHLTVVYEDSRLPHLVRVADTDRVDHLSGNGPDGPTPPLKTHSYQLVCDARSPAGRENGLIERSLDGLYQYVGTS